LYQAGLTTTQECRTLGWRAYKIGEEAILDLNTFTLQGKKGAAVRHMLARAKRANISISCWQGVTIPEHIFTGMQHVSTAWKHDQQIAQQMRFSMSCFPENWSPDLLTVVACDAGGEVQAFLTWTPIYATRGWALDLIRRSKTAAPGTIESLIVESLEWARNHGTTHLSLGLAPLAGLSGETERRPGSVLERGAAWLHQRGLLLGQYRSLRAFKAKFQPDWQERYLIVQERMALPKVVFALAWIQGYTWKTLLYQGASCLHAFPRRHRGHLPLSASDDLRTKGEAT
jgi:phosphatidylglycerol lysyltransferase